MAGNSRGSVKERHRAPLEMCSSSFLSEGQCSSVLPSGLIGPTSEVPVQIEGVYVKALLDSGSEVTILNRNFYNTYLAHLPFEACRKLGNLGFKLSYIPLQWLLSHSS